MSCSYKTGHLVSACTIGGLRRGEWHALTMFSQAMAGQPISSVDLPEHTHVSIVISSCQKHVSYERFMNQGWKKW